MIFSTKNFISIDGNVLNIVFNFKNFENYIFTWSDEQKFLDVFDNGFQKRIEFTGTESEYNEFVSPLIKIFNENINIILDEIKTQKIQKLTEISAKFEDNLNKDMYFISSLGFKSDGDRRTNMNIQSLIDTYSISQAQGLPVLYWDYDNVEHELSLQDLQTLKMEQIINGNNLYTQKKKFKELIENAKSIEELNKIDLTFSMMDFSVKS